MTSTPIIDVSADPAALAHRVAEWLVALMEAKEGTFALNLSGGSTPKALYGLLAGADFRGRVPWSRLHLFFGDERYVPWDDAESNYRMVREALIDKVPIARAQVHPVPYGPTPEAAAAAYERTLKEFYGADVLDPARPLFDVTLLGLGPDGHTASLFPGSPALGETERWVMPNVGEKPPPQRITLTYPALASSGKVAFLVAGADKHAMAERVRGGDASLPAARITADGELWWFLDEAAAGA